MRIVIAGGTGFIGQALVQHWQNRHQIIIIGRNLAKIRQRFGQSVQGITWNKLHSQREALHDAEFVINLCGANIGEKYWTKARKREILNSRIRPTHLLAEHCAKLGKNAPSLLNASAVGVYGLQKNIKDALPPALDEDTPINFHEYPDFLSYVGRRWEQACQPAERTGLRVVKMRFGVVLDHSGGALPKLMMPFKFFLGGPVGSGQQPFTWISLIDLIGAIDFIIDHPEINGPINLVSPGCVKQRELAKTLGKILHRPSFLPTPAFIIGLIFGQMGEELLLKGQHVIPTRLLKYGFEFQHSNLDIALQNITMRKEKSNAIHQ